MIKIEWPTMDDVKATNDPRSLAAFGSIMWAHVMAGNEPPEEFSEVMVEIGNRLEILPPPENMSAKARELITEGKQAK